MLVQMLPSFTTAASFSPLADEVMEIQLLEPELFLSTQLEPESMLVQTFPFLTTAATFSPLADEVMDNQVLFELI
jgi:hypothetical protein